jgi:hypothetical protein
MRSLARGVDAGEYGGWRGGHGNSQEERSSFLKKRSKKLLTLLQRHPEAALYGIQRSKVFLLLFL